MWPSPVSTPNFFILSNKNYVPIQHRAPVPPPSRPWQPLLFSVFLDLLAYLFKMEQLIPGKQR